MTTIDHQAPAYAARYGGELADHLPMSVSALARMGADASRIADFTRAYVAEKALRPLDERDAEYLARARMRERIAHESREAVLRAELRSLQAGLGAGAFHALIRAAYGVADANDEEIAAALTYWREAALDLGVAVVPIETTRFDIVAKLRDARERLGHVPQTLTGLIADRMAGVARDPAFAAVVGRPCFSSSSLAEIAALSVRMFSVTLNFTILHAMTATHAMRILLPLSDEPDAFLQSLWRAYVAAYVSAGAAEIAEAVSVDPARVPSWEVLRTVACASNNEHVIKATYTAWSEDAVYHDPAYRIAIARYLRLPL